MLKIKRAIGYILYYFIARHLPSSTVPYSLGAKHVRRLCAKLMFDKCGRNVNIEHGAFLASGKGIEIGDNSGIGTNCRITGPLSIGNDVMMAPGVNIITQNHEISDITIPMRLQTAEKKKITICDDVWIGVNAIILPGITVGKGSVIAGGAVVTKDVEPYTIVGGNPARVIRSRIKEQEK